MKKYLFILILSFVSFHSNGQGYGNWWEQDIDDIICPGGCGGINDHYGMCISVCAVCGDENCKTSNHTLCGDCYSYDCKGECLYRCSCGSRFCSGECKNDNDDGDGDDNDCFCYMCGSVHCNSVCDWGEDGDDPDPNELKKRELKQKICNTYNGVFDIGNIKKDIDNLTLHQQQFIISLANLAAMNSLGNYVEDLMYDLRIYPRNSNLFSKLNILHNHLKYTYDWEKAYNSSSGKKDALLSPIIGDTDLQLKYYPEKNGFKHSLGLVQSGTLEHGVEAALEVIEALGKNAGLPDDFLYDMHLYNSLEFISEYCDD